MRHAMPISVRHAFLLGLLALPAGSVACSASKDVDGGGELTPGDGGSTFDIGGDGSSPETGATFQEIELQPGNATAYIDTTTTPATPASVTYKAILHNDDGSSEDVTSSVVLTIDDPSLGTFSGTTFTSATTLPGGVFGISTVVHGAAKAKSGKANLTLVKLNKTGDHKDFFFVVPYGEAPSPDRDVLKFGTNIKSVDVAVIMDTTGSMSGSVENLKSNLSATVFPALVKAIPSVGLSVSYHDDYPLDPYGDGSCSGSLPGDVPVGVLQVITTDLRKAQDGANKLEVHCGNDGPESQIPAMWHVINGKELRWSGGSVPAHTPPAGTFGGVDFRPGSLAVAALITDVEWHDALGDAYGADITSPPSLDDLKRAFVSANARFVDITDEYGPEEQANELSDATKSNIPAAAFGACPSSGTGPCCTAVAGAGRAADGPSGNCRLNFRHSGGTGVSTSLVKAIQAISIGTQFDVTAVASNDPGNADGVDATKFIQSLRSMDEGDPAQGCPAHAAKDTNGDGIKDTFVAVVVGTPVCFEILPRTNDTVPAKPTAQFFNAFIDVLGMPGSVKLDNRSTRFLVPPRRLDVPR